MTKCNCGYGDGENHTIGEGSCARFIVTDPKEIPTNRRQIYNPDWFPDNVWVWDIDNYFITEYTLFNQRLYHQHENGLWSRPKSRDSVNSVEG